MPSADGPCVDDALVARLYRRAGAHRWRLDTSAFGQALRRSAAKARGEPIDAPGLAKYLESLHLDDLALAAACISGDEPAWEHFVLTYRPILYRAADALDPTGGARETADSLYGELYGLDEREGARRSLLTYFHGRSSLATWLRAVLAQRHVDRVRAIRKADPLEDHDPAAPAAALNPDRRRYVLLIATALARAVERLLPRERLRLGCYYVEHLTLAEAGRMLGEHEATVSRQLDRTRRNLRQDVEAQLRAAGLAEAEISACFESVTTDPGPLDVRDLVPPGGGKDRTRDRSIYEQPAREADRRMGKADTT